MRLIFFTAILILLTKFSFSQIDLSKENADIIFPQCFEIPPKYPGGREAIVKLFADSMRYPTDAENKKIGGRVIVQYIINTQGYITDVKLEQGVKEDLDQEALRLIKLLRRWVPATLNGKKINYCQRQPFLFIVDSESEQKSSEQKPCSIGEAEKFVR
jgi:TonB family protein